MQFLGNNILPNGYNFEIPLGPFGIRVIHASRMWYLFFFIHNLISAQNRGKNMEIISADSVSPDLPQDLVALDFNLRDPNGPVVRLCAVGDVSLSGRATSTLQQMGGDTLFDEVSPIFRSSDITFGNLECTLTTNFSEKLPFVAHSSGINILEKAGFTILNLANNHVYDMGVAGLSSTLDSVKNAGLITLGAGDTIENAQQLIRTDKKGIGIGWLGCARTLVKQNAAFPQYWEFDENSILDAVSKARKEIDFLVVSIHKGFSYIDYPDPDDKKLAKRLVDAGADLILMHHAHVLQGVQVISKERICCYCLGNFLFDSQEGNIKTPFMEQEQNTGAVFLFDLDSSGLVRLITIPTWIDDLCRVRWAVGERGSVTLERLKKISLRVNGDYNNEFEQQRAERNVGHTLKLLMYHAKKGDVRILLGLLCRIRIKKLLLLVRWLKTLVINQNQNQK